MVYLPIIPVILYYALRMRKCFFFSNVNPKFNTGALLGASKYDILQQIDSDYLPKTILLKKEDLEDSYRWLDRIQKEDMVFPLVAKPDVGERGLLVELIHNEDELKRYTDANRIDIIVQEYVDLPEECGIFYIRKPNKEKGKVVSVGLKRFMSITGDGQSTAEELLQKNERFLLQLPRLKEDRPDLLNRVLENGQKVNIEPIGNHSRGTHFIDGNHLLSKKLDDLFDKINESMDEVYYGRFDLKYQNWEDLLSGKNFKIIELNGVASEPIHVYDNRVSLRDKYKSFYQLWKDLFEISIIQKNRGIQPISAATAVKELLSYKKYMKSLNLNWRNPIT